ncbi:MAG TPA: hypothetical protein VFR23_22000 [Jiangellaceae bacterium]|nr:hypothetical protein [Jiangellaceae bacterium]
MDEINHMLAGQRQADLVREAQRSQLAREHHAARRAQLASGFRASCGSWCSGSS